MTPVRRPDPVRQLLRALAEAAPGFRFEHRDARPWSSATFEGARHRVAVAVDDANALALWLAGLPELELPMRGHYCADVAATASGGTAMLELLVLEG